MNSAILDMYSNNLLLLLALLTPPLSPDTTMENVHKRKKMHLVSSDHENTKIDK